MNNNNSNTKYHFEHNHQYLTISIYVLSVIILSSLAVMVIFNIAYLKDAFLSFLSSISSFIIAFFIAYFLNPLVKNIDKNIMTKLLKIKKEKTKKFLSILTAYVIFIGCIALILTIVIPQFFTQFFSSFTSLTSEKNLTYMYDKLNHLFMIINDKLPYFDWSVIENEILNYIPELISASTDAITEIFPKLINLSISIISGIINIILAVVVSCYMLSDKKILKKNILKIIYSIFPKHRAVYIVDTLKECNNIFYSFVIGKAIDSLIIGLLCFLLTSILQIPYSLLISVIVGVTNMIPYFGPFIGAIPCIVVLLFTEPIMAVVFTVLIFILQQFDGLYLGPKILGQSVGLTPMWVVFGITVGGSYGGFLGMFLGVPITAVLAFLLNKIVKHALDKHGVKEEEI